jgi:predicted regulator of Ras-like GTPase activity (Roadblock/LC7/MglB family)
MGFRESLTEIQKAIPETLLITLLDRDGITLETVSGAATDIDLNAYFVEVTGAFSQVERSSQQLSTGLVDELVVRTQNLATVIRRVSDEYLLALSMPPGGNTGKARYWLRITAPKVVKELSA